MDVDDKSLDIKLWGILIKRPSKYDCKNGVGIKQTRRNGEERERRRRESERVR